MRDGLVEGKVALVTGAGSGMGRATALKFIKEGAKVVIVDYNAQGGEETLQMVKKVGGEGIFINADVSRRDDVEAMVKKTVEAYGRLDCANNNAGVGGRGEHLVNCTEEDWDHVMSVNLKGMWHCMRAELKQMLEQGCGAIVNTISTGGLLASPFFSDYIASKHGAVGLTRAAALEYITRGIRINAVCPGTTKTGMTVQLQEDPKLSALFLSELPTHRFAEPEEIANPVVWLCSDEASFVNGQALAVDGGWTIQMISLTREIDDVMH